MGKIRFLENIHILFWLIKDISWVMIWKPLGIAMVFPTVLMAAWFCIKSFRNTEFYVYLATLCWILANAIWMFLEFFHHEEIRGIVAIPFCIGIVLVAIYIVLYLRKGGSNNDVNI